MASRLGLHMGSIEPFIHRKLVVLNEEDSCQDAARAMRNNEIGCILVGDSEGRLVGMVTDRDLACRVVADLDETDVEIKQIMTHDLVTVHDDANLAQVVHVMEEKGVRRVPVMKDGSCLGIITLDDLLSSEKIPLPHAARVVQSQVRQRPRSMGGSQRQTRSDARALQSLEKFYRAIGEATDLGPDTAPQVSYVILASIVRRITHSGASHFIAQLPKYLQGALLRVQPGPDRSVTVETMVADLATRFTFREEYAHTLLRNFFSGLKTFMDAPSLEHLKSQLPTDFHSYFAPEAGFGKPGEELELAPLQPKLELLSSSFKSAGEMPKDLTLEGAGRNPELHWSGGSAGMPKDAREYAVICEDLDSVAAKPFVHWVAYGIPANVTKIPEGIPNAPSLDLPIRITQGRNSDDSIGYRGPMPTPGSGSHRYLFKVYAIDREIVLAPGASRNELLAEIQGHVLAEGELIGRYHRPAVARAAKKTG